MGNDRAEPGEQGTPEGLTLEEVHLAQFEYFDLLVERRLRDLRHMRRKSSRTRALGSYVFDSATGRWVRMDPRLIGVALTSTCGRRVAVDVVLGSLAEMPT